MEHSTKNRIYTFFSCACGPYAKIYQLTNLKRIGIIQNVLCDCNGIKLEINSRRVTGISQSIWALYLFLSNQWVLKGSLKGN